MSRFACPLACSLVLLGCHGAPRPTPKQVTGCLSLPGASRSNLRLGPDGKSLYWTERTAFQGYEESWPQKHLVRWELDAAAPSTLTDLIESPYRVLADGRVVGLSGDSSVVVWDRGRAQLVSIGSAVDHLETLDDGTVVYAAAGQIWVQPLHREAARWLATGDVLEGVDGMSAIVLRGDALVRIAVTTGAESPLPAPDGEVIKAIHGAIVTWSAHGVTLRPADRAAREVVNGDDWQARLGPDGVKLWRKAGDHLEAALVDAAGADRLPPVTGGDGLDGFVRLPDGRIAYLVDHDTDRDGEVTLGDETDVCLAPRAATALAVTPRHVPLRLVAAEAPLAAAATALGAAKWRLNGDDDVPGVSFLGVPGRRDQAARWKDARTAAAAAIAAIGDPAAAVAIEYADGRRATSEWWATTHRRVALTGVGGVMVPDVADYDVVLGKGALAREDDGTIACEGEVTNQSGHPLADVVVDCVDGDDDDTVPVFPTTIPAGAVGHYAGKISAAADHALAMSVHRGPGKEPLAFVDRDLPARRQRLADGALEVLDRTRLTMRDWRDDGDAVEITLDGPGDFDGYSDAAREFAITTAHDVMAHLRGDLGGHDGAPLHLAIRAGGQTWHYDGTAITKE